MIAADFSVGKNRPLSCFAFTIFPYDAWPWDIERDALAAVPADLKNSKDVPESALAWLRDSRRFHLAVTVPHKRSIFAAGGAAKLQEARDHINKTLAQAVEHKIEGDALSRVKELKRAASANGFNHGLFGDMWLLALLFAWLSALLARECDCQIVGWFPDRDNMTNWCGGIWHDYAMWDTRALADAFEIEMRAVQIGIGLPDRSGGKEQMWFDHLVRSADWFAVAVAEWDRKTSFSPGKPRKYARMWEEVIADAENVLVLHVEIGAQGAQCRRIAATRALDAAESA